jgi:hypothetical protein
MMNGMTKYHQPLSSVQTVFPLGYDSRHHPRFILEGGGYTTICERDDSWVDAFRPSLRLNIRDVSIGGCSLLCRKKLNNGVHLIIPSPQGYLLRTVIARSEPDPLFTMLFRIGLRWCCYLPHKVFLEWQPYIQPTQLVKFYEQAEQLSKL